MSRTVLFLCTGNYYRSRFAQTLFNALADRAGLSWRASSRGLRAGLAGPGPISPYTVARVAELGIDCEDLRRMPAECAPRDLAHADLVIALKEDEHRPMLADRFTGWEDRVTYWHVHDIDVAKPEDALAEIEQLVGDLVRDLQANGKTKR